MAVPFDLDTLEVRGTPVAVLEGIAYSTTSGAAALDISRSGSLVHRSSRSGSGLVTVQWLDDSGKTSPLLVAPGNYLSPTVSPDGNSVAMTSAGDIWVYHLRRNTMMRLTFGGGCGNPLWSTDGRYVAFRSAGGIFWIRADGTGNPQQLTESKNLQVPWSFSNDGKRLAFVEVHASSGANLWTMRVESDASRLRAGGKPEAFLQTPFNERTPMFSTSGRWLAYSSNESGDYEVYVQAFPADGRKWKISSGGGIYPVWSRNGRELFFRNVTKRLTMVAAYTDQGDSLVPNQPRVWSRNVFADFSSTRSYDVAPSGKRIIALIPAETSDAEKSQGHLTFLLNFFDELRRRVPSGGSPVYR